MVNSMEIAGHKIGVGHPCFVIAEAGVNHNGDLSLAHRLVDEAVAARADAVKFQTFSAERLVSPQAPKAEYQLRHTDGAESQFEMLKALELSPQAHRELIVHCQQKGILFMSTPFDEMSADFLEELGVAAYKIPSGEITNLPLLVHVTRKGKPVIVSTGMSTLAEVAAAVQTVQGASGRDLALLHCVTNYPCDPKDCNLRAMRTMADKFNLPVGWSDHTAGVEISLAAVALGACVVEKHFTLDRSLPGPDHQASLEPGELGEMIRLIRTVQSALGDGVKQPKAAESVNLPIARKSLHWRRSLEAGAGVTAEDLVALRPGTGISPARLSAILGRKVVQAVRAGQMVTGDDVGLAS